LIRREVRPSNPVMGFVEVTCMAFAIASEVILLRPFALDRERDRVLGPITSAHR